MAEQVRAERTAQETKTNEEVKEVSEIAASAGAVAVDAAAKEKSDQLKAEMDDLLDDIETVLEEETFAILYTQKGGQ